MLPLANHYDFKPLYCSYNLLPRQHIRMFLIFLSYSDVAQVTGVISLPEVWSCTLVSHSPPLVLHFAGRLSEGNEQRCLENTDQWIGGSRTTQQKWAGISPATSAFNCSLPHLSALGGKNNSLSHPSLVPRPRNHGHTHTPLITKYASVASNDISLSQSNSLCSGVGAEEGPTLKVSSRLRNNYRYLHDITDNERTNDTTGNHIIHICCTRFFPPSNVKRQVRLQQNSVQQWVRFQPTLHRIVRDLWIR